MTEAWRLLSRRYNIYVYDSAYPVMISYVPGEDGAVSMNANYIIIDDMTGADKAAVQSSMALGLLKVEVEEVER